MKTKAVEETLTEVESAYMISTIRMICRVPTMHTMLRVPTMHTMWRSGRVRAVAGALFTVLLVALPSVAPAEPFMALRDGFACGDCHTNRSGGGLRSLTVEVHASDLLRLPNDGAGLLPAHDTQFSPNINDYFSVGGDFRAVETVLFRDDPDADGKVKNNTAFRDLDSHDFQLEQGTLYGQLRLVPELLSLYVDEQVAPGGATNREAFALLENVLPGGAYLKAGRFFPAWGLKLQYDASFVSAVSGLNFDRTLSGVEVGVSGLGWNWFVSASEGGDNLENLLTASTYYMWADVGPFNGLMLGASAARHEPKGLQLLSYTGFGGFSVGRWTVLAQGVYLDNERRATDGFGVQSVEDTALWASYVELNYLLNDWLNTRIAFDYMDPDDQVSNDERTRWSIGVDPFIDRFIQIRIFYRVWNGPENQPQLNRDELALEGHLLF